MTVRGEALELRRILVALDASAHSLAALEAASRLAAELRAELLGLFVEDVELLQVAALPFTRAMSVQAHGEQLLNPEIMARALRVRAAQARAALAAVAERRHVRWSFRVARGDIIDEVLSEAGRCDLVTLGKTSKAPVHHVRLGGTARTAAARASCSVLLFQEGTHLDWPVVALFDGSTRALAVASEFARSYGTGLVVLIVAQDPRALPRREREAAAWLERRGRAAHVRRVDRATTTEICHAVRAEGGGLLVLDREGPLGRSKDLGDMLDELECPVLLLR